jgi:hypothetical protein
LRSGGRESPPFRPTLAQRRPYAGCPPQGWSNRKSRESRGALLYKNAASRLAEISVISTEYCFVEQLFRTFFSGCAGSTPGNSQKTDFLFGPCGSGWRRKRQYNQQEESESKLSNYGWHYFAVMNASDVKDKTKNSIL